jgi:hypothetical protein
VEARLQLDLSHSKLYSTIISFSFSADAKEAGVRAGAPRSC